MVVLVHGRCLCRGGGAPPVHVLCVLVHIIYIRACTMTCADNLECRDNSSSDIISDITQSQELNPCSPTQTYIEEDTLVENNALDDAHAHFKTDFQ